MLPGSTPSATKTLARLAVGLTFIAASAMLAPHEIVASDRFRHVFGPCGAMPTGGWRKAISCQSIA